MRGISHAAGAFLAAGALTFAIAAAASAQAGLSDDDNPGYDAVNCPMPDGEGTHPACRLAKDGSIRVLFGQAEEFTARQADNVIVETWDALRILGNLGLENATASADDVIQVNIQPGDNDPLFAWKTGNIYIGEGSARTLGGVTTDKSTLDFRHEIIHLVQSRAYYMSSGRVFGDKTWWLEATAEMLPFYTDPAGAGYDAVTYGSAIPDMSMRNAAQYAPYQWTGNEFYQHAQRLYASTCAAGCTFTFEEIIDALNKGVYPFEDAARKAAFTDGLEAYAKYLLTGKHPDGTIVAPIADGTAFGDRIAVHAANNEHAGLGIYFNTTSSPPQFLQDEGIVEAEMDPDSVYPLVIKAGSKARDLVGGQKAKDGMPVMFRAFAGPEFWYRVDGGPITYHDGGSDLVFGPLHSTSGTGEVRIVAVAARQPETFYGTFEPVDLAGDWVFKLDSKKMKVVSKKCTGRKSAQALDESTILEYVSSVGAGNGAYKVGAPGRAEWAQKKPIQAILPRWDTKAKKKRPINPKVKYSGSLQLDVSSFTGELDYITPPPRKKRDTGAAFDVHAEVTLTAFEPATSGSMAKDKKKSKKAKAADPVPTLTATGTAVVETILVAHGVENTAATGNKVKWHVDTCTVRLEGPVTAERYPGNAITEPKIG